MKRTGRLSRKHWIMSWDKWVGKINGACTPSKCGYCKAVERCSLCLLDPKVCRDSESYYNKWRFAPTESKSREYELLILEATVKDGREWGYMGKGREAKYDKLLKEQPCIK